MFLIFMKQSLIYVADTQEASPLSPQQGVLSGENSLFSRG